LVGSGGRQIFHMVIGDKLNPKCVKTAVKLGGATVMVWDIFSSEVFGFIVAQNGTVKTKVYCNLVEQPVLHLIQATSSHATHFKALKCSMRDC